MTGQWDGALGAEQEDEASEGGVIAGQRGGLEALEGELIVSLVIKPDLLQVRDQVPVTAEVDGIVKGLVHGRQLAATERPVERVAGAFAFHNGDVLRLAAGRWEAAESRVREL